MTIIPNVPGLLCHKHHMQLYCQACNAQSMLDIGLKPNLDFSLPERVAGEAVFVLNKQNVTLEQLRELQA